MHACMHAPSVTTYKRNSDLDTWTDSPSSHIVRSESLKESWIQRNRGGHGWLLSWRSKHSYLNSTKDNDLLNPMRVRKRGAGIYSYLDIASLSLQFISESARQRKSTETYMYIYNNNISVYSWQNSCFHALDRWNEPLLWSLIKEEVKRRCRSGTGRQQRNDGSTGRGRPWLRTHDLMTTVHEREVDV